MKKLLLFLMVQLCVGLCLQAQTTVPNHSQETAIDALITTYSKALENRDTALLKRILIADIDQLVSTREWRKGIQAAVQGMLKSSANTPGTRTLIVDEIRILSPTYALADCRYEVGNSNGTSRKMWSTFLMVAD